MDISRGVCIGRGISPLWSGNESTYRASYRTRDLGMFNVVYLVNLRGLGGLVGQVCVGGPLKDPSLFCLLSTTLSSALILFLKSFNSSKHMYLATLNLNLATLAFGLQRLSAKGPTHRVVTI